MPRWGLTRTQMGAEPWGLPAAWLKPAKTVTDPVHGDIYLNKLEQAFLDSPPMQRLRRVRQLGTTVLVYPGATQTRLSHALGTLRAAQDLLDAVVATRHGPRPAQPAPDLFSEWSAAPNGAGISEYDRKLSEVTVLARLGALLHDFGHVPFGHTIEDELKVLKPHDENWERFDALWSLLPDRLRGVMAATTDGFIEELDALIISKQTRDGKKRQPEESRYPFVADIVGNTICADLIDYLQRDHLYTGLPMALGERFTTDFYVNGSTAVRYASRMVIRITRNGRERVDVVSELLKYLRYRYELSERVLTHHAKLAADAMIGKLLEMWTDWLWVEEARGIDEVVAKRHGRDPAALRRVLAGKPGKARPGEDGWSQADHVKQLADEHLEKAFRRRGDDGLLEYLRDFGEEERDRRQPEGAEPNFQAADDGDGNRERRAAIGELAEDVLNRRLYKLLGRASQRDARANAEELYAQFGDPDTRRELEIGAARRAGLQPRWGVVIWLPPPAMRLKVAGVLVDRDGSIAPLDKVGHARAAEIYGAHEDLWAVSIYAVPRLSDDEGRHQADVVLAHIAEKMQVQITRPDGQVVPPLFDLVVRDLIGAQGGSRRDEEELRKLLSAEVAAHSGSGELERTYTELVEIARSLWSSRE